MEIPFFRVSFGFAGIYGEYHSVTPDATIISFSFDTSLERCLAWHVPSDSRKQKKHRSPGQTQISISIEESLLELIKVRAAERHQSVSGYFSYLAEVDLGIVKAAFPQGRSQPFTMNEKHEPRGK